jgi:hypothetical protein
VNVLKGEARLQGLPSLPAGETNVRCAAPLANDVASASDSASAPAAKSRLRGFLIAFSLMRAGYLGATICGVT